MDELMGRVGFESLFSYHSAAEQLLYGTAWQVATPTLDDVVYEALVGNDAASAVPGYDPTCGRRTPLPTAKLGEHRARCLPNADRHPGAVVVPDR